MKKQLLKEDFKGDKRKSFSVWKTKSVWKPSQTWKLREHSASRNQGKQVQKYRRHNAVAPGLRRAGVGTREPLSWWILICYGCAPEDCVSFILVTANLQDVISLIWDVSEARSNNMHRNMPAHQSQWSPFPLGTKKMLWGLAGDCGCCEIREIKNPCK